VDPRGAATSRAGRRAPAARQSPGSV